MREPMTVGEKIEIAKRDNQSLSEGEPKVALSENELENAVGGMYTPGRIDSFRWVCCHTGCIATGPFHTSMDRLLQDSSWEQHMQSNPGHTSRLLETFGPGKP